MKKSDMFQLVESLAFDTKKYIYEASATKIFLLRPSELSAKFKKKNYDVEKNFQIWIEEGDRKFRPNHLRVFIDLNLRVRCRPDLKKDMLLAFDNIYYGADPEKELQFLSNEAFDHFLNDIIVIGYLAQLFVIEQEYNYPKTSKYDPATLFFQGWVRQFLDSPKEIDNLCMSVAKGQPPQVKYTKLEDKKHKAYKANRPLLWYLQ